MVSIYILLVCMLSFKKSSASGAIDVIVIEHSDGSFLSTPFHVVFSRFKRPRSSDKEVKVFVNGSETPVCMKVGKKGKAFFATRECADDSEASIHEEIEKISEVLLENRKSVEMSICGTTDLSQEKFNEKRIPIDMLKSNPMGVLMNPNLLLRINKTVYHLEQALQQLPKTPCGKYKRYTPTLQEIVQFNLKSGKNFIDFRLGQITVKALIYLWTEDSKLVVSDIDGTITKSDVRGHLYTALGIDWSHERVAELYQNVVARGYKMIYLSSRSISMVDTTKSYLQKVVQNGVHLPEGPVIIAPTNFWTSLVRDVSKKSYELKFSILLQIKWTFPFHVNPFHAGFGNRDTDINSYKDVEMPHRFIINSESQIWNSNNEQIGNHGELLAQVDSIFPALASPSK